MFFFLFCPQPEQILNSIKQEYKRIQKRKHLDGGYHQSECCYSPESPSQSSTMNVSSMPGWLNKERSCIRITSWHILVILCFFQERPPEAFLPLEKNSHYSPSDKLEWSANACWKKGKRRCGRNTRRPWLQNWQVGTHWASMAVQKT